jgi:hypothetical protein
VSRPQFSDEEDRRLVASGPKDWREWWRCRGRHELSCILMIGWDPIGVSDLPDGWGECAT